MKKTIVTILVIFSSHFIIAQEYETVTDIDGNVYQTVQIGDQLWMKENLKVTHYRNGDEIPTGHNQEEWNSLTIDQYNGIGTGAYTFYNNDTSYFNIYGNLYNWYAAMDERGICPEGWHVPSDDEYTVLTDFLGGESVAGGKMKEVGFEHWNSPNTGATNESGFTGLPAGYRYYVDGSYNYMGNYGYFWSSSEYYSDYAWYRLLNYSYSTVARSDSNKRTGFSVRCLGD